MSDISDAIEDSALKAKRSAKGDASLERHSLTDQIEADRYIAAKEADTSGVTGLRIFKQNCGGAWD